MRKTGEYSNTSVFSENVKSFTPYPLPPVPPLKTSNSFAKELIRVEQSLLTLNLASKIVPDKNWLIYGFARKEALISSQIEGTQATLEDILDPEQSRDLDTIPEIEEVSNYIRALNFCVSELKREKGLPISLRLIKKAHAILMSGVRGESKDPGEFRRIQNWIGGTRPGNAKFVPTSIDKLDTCLSQLERYFHSNDKISPIIKTGLIHVQFETIHPFLDGNGRVGRLLIIILMIEWGLIDLPILYLSLYFKRTKPEYYRRLSNVRTKGDWEGWNDYYIKGINLIAKETAQTAELLFSIVNKNKVKLLVHKHASVVALRLLDELPKNPIITLSSVVKILDVTKPTAQKAIDLLAKLSVIKEMTGKERGKKFIFKEYVNELAKGTEL